MTTHDNGAYVMLVERLARAMWDARYSTYKWDDVAGDDAYGRASKKEGFRVTARAALATVADATRELRMPVVGDDYNEGFNDALSLLEDICRDHAR